MAQPIRVLHVDDESDFAELTAELLEREDARFVVDTVTRPRDAMERLDDDIDCVVSDYDMPETNGIEFLEMVREGHPDRPFILFTGKGSETVASEAISADVTDYLQKKPTGDQYTVLANRITNAVEKYRTEKQLERQNDLFQKAQDIANVGAWEYDVEREELRWTEKVYDIHDLSTEFDPTLEKAKQFYHPDDRPKLAESVERAVRDGEPYDIEVRLETDDDERRWVRTVADPQIADGDVVRVRGTLHDITDSKEREHELRTERERFSALFGNFPEPTLAYEYVEGMPVIRAVNESFEELFGFDAEQAVGTPVDELIVPAERLEEAKRIDRQVEGGKLVDEVVRRQTADGERYFKFRNIRTPPGDEQDGFGVYIDIHDNREREQKVEELQAVTRELMRTRDEKEIAKIAVRTATDTLELPMSSVYTLDDTGESLSPLFSSDQVDGLFDGVPVYDRTSSIPVDDTVWQVFESGEMQLFENVGRETELEDRPVRSVILAPIGDHGVFISSAPDANAFDAIDVGVVDILAKTVEAALDRRVYERKLEEKNERLDEFASLVSHDMRNPLSTLELSLEMAAETGDDEHFQRSQRAVDRMTRLLEDLLQLARQGNDIDETVPVELATVLEEAWKTTETDGAELSVDADLTLSADRARLKQLLENLIRNAVEHGSTSPASQAQQDAVEHSSTSPASQAQQDADVELSVGDLPGGFYVADDGHGIPPAEHERVFDTGHSNTGGGTGLGLAIVQDIVRAHGWDITVTESAQGGAQFEITAVETPD